MSASDAVDSTRASRRRRARATPERRPLVPDSTDPGGVAACRGCRSASRPARPLVDAKRRHLAHAHTRGARSTRGRLRAGTVMRRPDQALLVYHGSVILRIDASPPHRRCVPAALRGAGGGHRTAAAPRCAGRACLPDDRDPLSAERARRRCRLALARVPRRLTRRAAHTDRQARRDDPNAGLPAVGDRERRRRDLGGRPRPTPRSCASRPGPTGRRSASTCRRRRSTSGAEAASRGSRSTTAAQWRAS